MYLEIGMTVGRYLIDNQHTQAALALLAGFRPISPTPGSAPGWKYLGQRQHARSAALPEAFACLDQALEVAAEASPTRGGDGQPAMSTRRWASARATPASWEKADHAYQRARNNSSKAT